MDENLLTAREAMALLKKEKSAFYENAKQGVYPSVRVKGRLLFPREAIEALIAVDEPEDAGLRFVRSTNADIWERHQRNLQVYGPEDMITYRRALEWVARNDDICMSVYDGDKQVGGVTIMPVDEPVILAICRDEIREADLPLTAIRKWSDSNLSVYFPTISIIPSGDKQLDARRGSFLIKHSIRWAISLHIQHDIKNWYGVGVTPEGQAILESLGFQEFLSLEDGERKSYKLDSLKNGSSMLRALLSKFEDSSVALS